MFIPARILRATARSIDPNPPFLTPRERDQLERALSIGKGLLAIHGRNAMRFADMAHGLGMAVATLRKHFTDLDALLGEILRLHLRGLSRALGTVASNDPDLFRKRRAAYLAYTRTPLGGLTYGHLLLVRDRGLLPADERDGIELTLQGLGECLLPPQHAIHVEVVLDLLDTRNLNLTTIDAALAVHIHGASAPPAQESPAEQPPAEQPPAGEAAAEHPKAAQRATETPSASLNQAPAWFDPLPGDEPGNWVYAAAESPDPPIAA